MKQLPSFPVSATAPRGPRIPGGMPLLFALPLIWSIMACSGAKPVADRPVTIDPESGAPIDPAADKRAETMRLFMEATQARLAGQGAKAIQLFQQCLKLDPTNAAAMFEVAKLYHQAQDFPKALDHAKRAVDADKENIWYRFLLADLYQQNGQVGDATKVYQDIVAKWPERYEVYFDLANMLAYGGRVDDAIKVYGELEKRFGLSEDLIMQEFGMLSESGRHTEAEALVKRAIAAHPGDPQYEGLLAEVYDQQGEHEKALEQYKKTLELDPGNSMLRIALAEHYYSTGKMDEAYHELGQAFLDPDLDIDAKMQVLIGFFEMTEREGEKETDRPDLIRRSYELIEALEKAHPESGKPHTIHGDFLLRDGKIAEARDQFREALRTEKERFPIHLQLLQLDLQLRDHAALHTDAEEAISLFPTVPEPYLYNGIALSQLGRHDEAIETLITGRDVVVDNPQLQAQFWSSLGDAYNEAERFTDSDKAYDKALSLEPDNAGTLNNYAYYLSLRNEQLEKAERMSKRSLEISPGAATYMDTYAWVLFRMRKYADARVWIEKALATGEPDGTVVEHYGDILFELGDKSGATEQWRKAKVLGGGSDALDRKINEGARVE
ncbi:MAG TPA: tetratricopeptide repeat protein [Flavobacteriales bacterium]|nr:tetratricopeptide repeat protein [Flavobacteriales bacterium]